MVYPVTAHCKKFQHDEEGGFVIEATTIQDPISFATTLMDENGPFWGERLVEAVKRFRHWVGLLALCNDENGSRVVVDESGGERFDVDFQPPSSSASTARSASAARCSRLRARRRSAGRGSPRRTSRAPAAWATTPRARSSTATASRTR